MLISLLLACGSGDGPPEIHYDTDPCDLCGMVIRAPASAAALVTDAGQTFTFDDPRSAASLCRPSRAPMSPSSGVGRARASPRATPGTVTCAG